MARTPVLREWLQNRVDQYRCRINPPKQQLSLGDYLYPEDHDRYNHWLSATRSVRDQALTTVKRRSGEDEFQAIIDVHHFAPEELSVKVTNDDNGSCITVEGKHEARADDHGQVERHFLRKYPLPEGYDSKRVISLLSSDGILVLKVPKLVASVATQAGKRHIEAKEMNGGEMEKQTKKLKV